MLRTSRPLLAASTRSLATKPASIAPFTTSHTRTSTHAATAWRVRVPSRSSPQEVIPYFQRARLATKSDQEAELEKELAKKKLERDPEHVTADSSVRKFEGMTPKPYDDASTTEGVKRDLTRLKETLALGSVPPLSYQLGFAGTIPYLATSIATVFLSWDMNTQWPSSSQFLNHFMISHENAAHYLHLLEPIQVGYGAVIISFLGAIHWGLEYAEKHPEAARTRFRYGMGVLAPMLAWPTMALPVQFALTAQFAAFTVMYFLDARATTKGWTPQWYGTYRFVLTFVVGGAILISLIGREKIGPDQPRLTGLREKLHKEGHDALAEEKWQKLEEKEFEKNRKKKAAEEKKKAAEEKQKEAEEEKKKIDEEEKQIDSDDKPSKGKGGDKKKKDDGKEAKSDDKSKDKKESKDEDSEGKEEGEKKDDKKEDKSEGGDDDKKDEKSE